MEEFIEREFCNHLYLGQWELARACAFALVKNDSKSDHRKRLFSTLRLIAHNPFVVRSAWTTVSCPSYVSLLACQLLLDLGCENVASVRKEADFNVLLEAYVRTSQSNLIEVSSIYSHLLKIKTEKIGFKISDFKISRQSISCLRSAFAENPVVISRLLNMLCVPNDIHLESNINAAICDIHLQNLLNNLRSIKAASTKSNNSNYVKETASKVYFLLNVLPDCILNESGKPNTGEVFSCIIQLCKDGILDGSNVSQSFLSRPSPSLFKYFCDFQDQDVDESNVSEAADGQRILKCYTTDRDFSHHGALLRTVRSSSHFLKDLLDFCIKHILDGNLSTVQDTLKDPLLARLKPLLLILSWDNCQNDVSSNNVLQAIKSYNEHTSDSVLDAAYNFFKLNTTLLDLCMNFYRNLYPDASLNKLHTKSRSIFSSLQTESPLRVVHTAFGLKNFPPVKVEEILNVTQGEKNFALDGNLYLTDRAVYSGYLALTSIMDAIHLSCEYKDLLLAKKLSISEVLCADSKLCSVLSADQAGNTEPETSPQSLPECIDNRGPREAYNKFILSKIQEAKKEVKSIFPFAFRIEIMENIFSLLFSMSNVLLDSLEPGSDSDQGHEGEISSSPINDERLSSSPTKDECLSSKNDVTRSSEKVFSGRFIISMVKLKDCGDAKYSRQLSSKSTESNSSSGLQAYTFLCNELITRDVLSLLYDLVIDVKSDVYKAMGQSDSGAKIKLQVNSELEESEDLASTDCPTTKPANESTELPERISRLLHHVNEAKWRYEVVKSGIFQGAFGVSPLQQRTPHLFQMQWSASSSDGADKEIKKRRKKKRHKRNVANYKKEFFAESSIIQCMLSSPEALLRYSLWSRNLKQAGQVIQLFHLQKSPEAKEVILIQELQRISQKLVEREKIKRKLPRRSFSLVVEGKSLMSSIQAIGDAAATGLRSSEICLAIHAELSSLKVPELVDITGGVRHPELMLGSENISSIFLADLGCTSGASLDLSSVLLDMSSRTWNTTSEVIQDLDAKVLSKKKMPLIRGVYRTLGMMSSLVKEFVFFLGDEDVENDLRSLFWPSDKGCSNHFPQVLSGFVGSLDCQRFKEERDSWKLMSELLEEFTVLMKDEESNVGSVQDKDVLQENKLHISYKKLSKVLRELRDWSSETIRPHQVRYENYLSKLLIHLHQVTAAILDCKKQSINTDSSVYTSDFSILKESPVELLKKIILQSGVEPEKIEKFAIRMKVDLTHVLAQACLPHVALFNNTIPFNKLIQSQNISTEGISDYPLLILNKSKTEWLSPRHPDLAARELLKDLIGMIQDTVMVSNSSGIFTVEELISVSQSSQLNSWIQDCSELEFVDLDLLQTKEEKLAFFINVTNLAWLHAILFEILYSKSQDKESENSDFQETILSAKAEKIYFQLLSSNIVERLTTQKVIGYSVGQLGDISLFDLRYQLLHAQLPVPKHLEVPPFYQLLGDPKTVWEKYMPPVEPRTLFVLVEGLQYSPKLQVMYSENIEADLEEAATHYLDFTVNIDTQNKTALFPKLLEWYVLDFSKGDEKDTSKALLEGLLNSLDTLANKGLGDSFQALFSGGTTQSLDSSGKKQQPFRVKFKDPCLLFGIMLDYNTSDITPQPTNMPKASIITENHPIVLNHLKGKCPILSDLYEIFRSESVLKVTSKENLCIETYAKKLFSIQESYSNVPVTYLLAFYKNMLVVTDDDHSWFSSALSPLPNRAFFSHQIENCFLLDEWHKALLFVDLYLEEFGSDWTYVLLRQLVLEHLATLGAPTCSMEPYCYALCITDPVVRAKTVLQNVHKWQDSCAVQTLKFCLSDRMLVNHPDVYKSLSTKLKEVLLYKKIFNASEFYNDSDARDCVYVFNNWQEVSECSVWDQSRILDFIKANKKYELAVHWAELHVINKEQKMLALSMSIIWHLTQDSPQEQAIYEIMDAFEDPSDCIQLCDLVLPELPTVEGKLCLVQYIVDRDFSHDRKYHYLNMALGLKMLCALRSPKRDNYNDLVAHPYLLLEQMLMNVELRDAELSLKAVQDMLVNQKDMIPVLTLSSVNLLVEDYASKALEVHFLDALLDCSSSSTLILSTEETLVSDEPFMIPIRVPTKDEWVPDAKIQRCQVCKEERFNMFSRRHHCRRCGRVVCANCSQHALIVDGYGKVKVRVCDDCYNAMTGSLSLTTASFEKRYRVLSSMRSSPRNSPFQSETPNSRRRASSISSTQPAFRWILSPDSEQNASVRNEFSYEQTPSISLCYSILKLHSDDRKCAQFMMNLCDRLLGKIKMRRSGKIPLEIDYSLIISMMKSLLMNAKVKCHQVQDNEGEALAELYFQHLDIIKLLVNANCRHLIPRETVTNTEKMRKLRDKLLEEERMQLALVVSTKFNLDKVGVWSCWGLFCLKAGDWPTARLKFQQCLKVVNDKNDRKKENPLLNKILKVLEDSKYPGTEKASTIFKSLSSLRIIKAGLAQFETEVFPLDELIKKECLFYLNMYGTHFTTVVFYRKNGMLSEALDYIIEKKCDPDIFIEALFMPALKNMQLSSLKYLMTNTDPALSLWSSYLFATCRHLERIRFLNVLYEIQMFMEDYARAAKSAINFYLTPAPSYKSLFERHRHLHNAKKHYELYLMYSRNTDSVSESWKRRKSIKALSVKEVESYIQIIAFQEEVSKFLNLCVSQSHTSFLYEVDVMEEDKCPPTLFGNVQRKSEVVLMVLINSVNVDEGFELAVKLLKAFNLDATAILCKAGSELVRIRQKQQIPHYLASVKCLFSKIVKVDDVILECVSAVSKQGGDVEDIIKMLTSDSNKINAYLICGKLKSAYLLAIRLSSALDVRRIMMAAEQCGQDSIQRICRKWLETNSLKLKPKEPSFLQ